MNRSKLATASIVAVLMACGILSPASAQHRIRDLCRVKGQEVNQLRGVGLVVGLAGSGDPTLQTTRAALARVLTNSGMELPADAMGREDLTDFEEVMNVALVMVTAEVPGEGARQGTLINCRVHALGSAKSLQGGTLMQTVMTGGAATGDSAKLPVLAMASGRIEVLNPDLRTTGLVTNGCQLAEDFNNTFVYFDEPWDDEYVAARIDVTKNQMYIDLVINRNHASFGTASEIADEINANAQTLGAAADQVETFDTVYAVAKDQTTVQVIVPEFHQRNPVSYVNDVLDIKILIRDGRSSTVVINERNKTVVIGQDVHFGPVAIASGDFTVDPGSVVPLNLENNGPVEGGPQQRLLDLQNALQALQAPPETLIKIIKQLDSGGYLYGRLVIEE